MAHSVQVTNNCPDTIRYRAHRYGDYVENVVSPGSVSVNSSHPQFTKVQGQLQQDVWSPCFEDELDLEVTNHRVTLTPIFGPRTAKSIKVYMACLAGPADPNERNDIALIKEFSDAG